MQISNEATVNILLLIVKAFKNYASDTILFIKSNVYTIPIDSLNKVYSMIASFMFGTNTIKVKLKKIFPMN